MAAPIPREFKIVEVDPWNDFPSWTDDAKAELHLLGMNLHNMAVEFQCRRHPAEAAVLEGYAIRIDELMKRAPEAVS